MEARGLVLAERDGLRSCLPRSLSFSAARIEEVWKVAAAKRESCCKVREAHRGLRREVRNDMLAEVLDWERCARGCQACRQFSCCSLRGEVLNLRYSNYFGVWKRSEISIGFNTTVGYVCEGRGYGSRALFLFIIRSTEYTTVNCY